MLVLLLLGTFGVIAAGGLKPKKPKKKKVVATHVGPGNYNWAHRDLFPKEQSLWDWFTEHGYESRSLIFPYKDMVEQFQYDYNKVNVYLWAKGFPRKMKHLYVDGLIGDATIASMHAVTTDILPSVHKGWQPLVAEAWASGQGHDDPVMPPIPEPPPSLWGSYGKDCMMVQIDNDHVGKYHDVPHEGLTAFSVLGLQNDILNQTPGDSVLTMQAGSRVLFLSYADDHQHDVTLSEHKKQALSRGETVAASSSFHEAGAYKGSGHMHIVKLRCDS